MSMWLPGGAGASSISGSSTTCRTCWATSQTSSTRALRQRLCVVAPMTAPPASEASAHEAGGGLLAVTGDRSGGLGPEPRAAVRAAVGVGGVGRLGHGAHGHRRVGGPLGGLLDVRPELDIDHALHHTAGPHAAGVDVEVVEVVAGIG